MGKLYLTLGDKGGIGKSFVAALMTQYILDNKTDIRPVPIDLDCKNRTLSRYEGLDVELIDVRTDGDIDRSKFDLLVNRIVSAKEDEIVIADVGGNVYVPMTDYMKVNQIYELLMSMGVDITLHIPIVGGGDMFPTLATLDELMHETPKEVKACIWINQKNGKVEYQGTQFEDSDRYNEYRERIGTVCYIPLWRSDMQADVAEMLEEALTFKAAQQAPIFDIVSKQRLIMAKRYLYTAIERAEVI